MSRVIKTNRVGNFEYRYLLLTATSEQVKQAENFAKKFAQKSHHYYSQKRNQSDLSNIEDQCRASKIFEFMVMNMLAKIGRVTIPDCNIYDPNDTEFDQDLIFYHRKKDNHYNIHIKSQDARRINPNRPISWGFQKEDKLFEKSGATDRLYMGVYVRENEGHLLAFDSVEAFVPHIGQPKKESLKGIKEFIYYDINAPAFQLRKK